MAMMTPRIALKFQKRLLTSYFSQQFSSLKKENRSLNVLMCRQFCSKPQTNSTASGLRSAGENAAEQNAIVLTPYQKVAATARGGMYLGFAGLALVCGGYIIRELLPTRTNPNHLFGEALDEIIAHYEVISSLGTPIRGYGRDHGGRREGRRNFIEHADLKDKDGNSRLRIRFNLQGPNGKAIAFAEVRKGMPKGTWVYLIVQTLRTGEIITLHDNRGALADPDDTMSKLIHGGRS